MLGQLIQERDQFSLFTHQNALKLERRRSMISHMTHNSQSSLLHEESKELTVRTPRLGRSRSISIPTSQAENKNFPISRLNNYDEQLKKHKGPLSMVSELDSILDDEEGEDKINTDSLEHSHPKVKRQKTFDKSISIP